MKPGGEINGVGSCNEWQGLARGICLDAKNRQKRLKQRYSEWVMDLSPEDFKRYRHIICPDWRIISKPNLSLFEKCPSPRKALETVMHRAQEMKKAHGPIAAGLMLLVGFLGTSEIMLDCPNPNNRPNT